MLFHSAAPVFTIEHDMAEDHETDAADDQRTAQRRAIGQRIVDRRTELNLTQHELGLRTLKISGNEISRWERGQNKPSSENLELLAEALGVSPSYLLFGADAPAGATQASAEVAYQLRGINKRLSEIVDIMRSSMTTPDVKDVVVKALTTLGLDPEGLLHSADESLQPAPSAPPSRSPRSRVSGQ